MSSAEVQAVLAVLTQSLLDSGPKSPADLHRELDDAIIEVMTEQDPDAFPPDSDEPDWAPVDEGAPLSLADLSGPRGFMAARSDPDTGDATLDLPIVDVMSMDDPDIFAALDEVRTACAGALGEAMDRSHAVFRLMGSTDAHVSLEGHHDKVSVLTGGEATQLAPRECDGKVMLPIDVRSIFSVLMMLTSRRFHLAHLEAHRAWNGMRSSKEEPVQKEDSIAKGETWRFKEAKSEPIEETWETRFPKPCTTSEKTEISGEKDFEGAAAADTGNPTASKSASKSATVGSERPRALDDWVRTTWAHRNGCWTLWEREVASSTGMRVNQTPDLKMVILLQPPRDYMSTMDVGWNGEYLPAMQGTKNKPSVFKWILMNHLFQRSTVRRHFETQRNQANQVSAILAFLGRPDILYMVSRLQSEIKGATIQTVRDANKCVELTLAGVEIARLRFPYQPMEWSELGILSVSDASFANEASMEAGDRYRALLVEMKGLIGHNTRDWEDIARRNCPQLSLSDCMSLVKHLNSDLLSKCQDKRLEIEMRSMRQSLREEDDRKTYVVYPNGGDRLNWIHTSSMISDCLTKRMKPDLMLRILKENAYQVCYSQKKKT
ncbi:unnamed protein product [Durusdinium trenchii]|uniref:Uncharacterized protein n=1 Tax=Durusdinium trenchii TaxID=1381693 RepID=A0ABP0RXL7_9DINO